jgi:hypothetical protein
MLLRCRALRADLRLLFWLIALLIRITVGDWLRTAARALNLRILAPLPAGAEVEAAAAAADDRVSERFSLRALREQPWALLLCAVCLLATDAPRAAPIRQARQI